jgi:hypothetical protein
MESQENNMRKYLLGLFLAWFPLYGNTIVVNSTIGLYDITTVTGIYSEYSGLLQQQVWWGDESLAYEMMSLSEGFDGLGYPNTGFNESPYFAYEELTIDPDSVTVWTSATGCIESVSCRAFQKNVDGGGTWAVAQVVPIPSSFWLFGSALIGLTGVKRKK